jgi:hypothetical protein
VTGELVSLPDPADLRALPMANLGNKPTKPVEISASQMKSWAAEGLDAFAR